MLTIRCTPSALYATDKIPDGEMHDSRDSFWKRIIFKVKQREWDESQFGRAMVHDSVMLRTASIDNKKDGGYKPWILKEDPGREPWTHLADWKRDPEFQDKDAQRNLAALEGWCTPTRPNRP